MSGIKNIKVDPTEIVLRNIVREFGIGGFSSIVYDNAILGYNGIKNFVEDINITLRNDKYRYTIYFEDFRLEKPKDSEGNVEIDLTPAKARREFKSYFGITYFKLVFRTEKVDKNGEYKITKEEEQDGISLGSIPVMLKSKFCHLSDKTDEQRMLMGEKKNDPGHYYINNGKSKILEAQDMMAYETEIRTMSSNKKNHITMMYIPTHRNIKVVKLMKGKLNNIKVSLKSLSKKTKQKNIENNKFNKKDDGGSINICHLANILGYTIDDVLEYVTILLGDKDKKKKDCLNAFKATLLVSNCDETTSYIKFALKCLLKIKGVELQYDFKKLSKQCSKNPSLYEKIKEKVDKLVHDELFPNINNMFDRDDVIHQKFMMLCMMITNHLEYITGYKTAHDKNNWNIKGLKLSGDQIKKLFKIVINNLFFLDNMYGRGKKLKNNEVDNTSSYCIKSRLKDKLEKVGSLKFTDVSDLLKPVASKVTKVFKKSLGGTCWGYKIFKKMNIVQSLPVNNFFLLMSYITKITVESSKHNGIKERKYQLSSLGTVCAGANPDNDNCGLKRDMAIISMVSCETDILDVKEFLDNNGIAIRRLNRAKRYFSENKDKDAIKVILTLPNIDVEIRNIKKSIRSKEYDLEDIKEKINSKELDDVSIDYDIRSEKDGKLYLNGIFVGFVNLFATFNYLVNLKRSGAISKYTSIVYDQDNYLKVCTTESRAIRLFYTINKFTCRLKIDEDNMWERPIEELIRKDYLTYLDVQETSFYYICPEYKDLENYRKKLEYLQLNYTKGQAQHQEYIEAIFNMYDYCEINPNVVFGYIGNTIPQANRMPLIRQAYAIKHKPQSMTNIGVDITEESNKISMTQDPQVATLMDWELSNQNPTGNQVISAIFPDSNTLEDAFIINRASIQNKGLFNYYKIYIKSSTINENFGEEIGNPTTMIEAGKKLSPLTKNFSNIDENGLPIVGSIMKEGYCVIPKFMYNKRTGEYKFIGEYMKSGETGVVMSVKLVDTVESSKEVVVKLRDFRVSQVGDKFAYPYAQKMTIGRIEDPENMPFAEDGTIPDVVIGPFIFINRSTAGMLLVGLIGVAAVLQSAYYNVTTFKKIDETYFKNILTKHGRNPFGLVNMYNGETGMPIEKPVNLAILQLNQLDRNSIDIIQARGHGGVKDPKTQQAVKTKMGGGIKTGWMERNLFISQGAGGLLFEKMLLNADPHKYKVCKRCSLYARYKVSIKKFVCNKCGDKAEIGNKIAPFSSGFMYHLLLPLGIFYKHGYISKEEYSDKISEITE